MTGWVVDCLPPRDAHKALSDKLRGLVGEGADQLGRYMASELVSCLPRKLGASCTGFRTKLEVSLITEPSIEVNGLVGRPSKAVVADDHDSAIAGRLRQEITNHLIHALEDGLKVRCGGGSNSPRALSVPGVPEMMRCGIGGLNVEKE